MRLNCKTELVKSSTVDIRYFVENKYCMLEKERKITNNSKLVLDLLRTGSYLPWKQRETARGKCAGNTVFWAIIVFLS
jgi:hypothetical protein